MRLDANERGWMDGWKTETARALSTFLIVANQMSEFHRCKIIWQHLQHELSIRAASFKPASSITIYANSHQQ
jgi:hypothetical protein